MTHVSILLGGLYLAVAVVFSIVYYSRWRTNTDTFIVHQEMNLRPLSLWRQKLKKTAKAGNTTAIEGAKSLEEVTEKYQDLVAQGDEAASELQEVKLTLEIVKADVDRLGKLHNQAMATNMQQAIDQRQAAYQLGLKKILQDMEAGLISSPDKIQETSAAFDGAIKSLTDAQHISTESIVDGAKNTRIWLL